MHTTVLNKDPRLQVKMRLILLSFLSLPENSLSISTLSLSLIHSTLTSSQLVFDFHPVRSQGPSWLGLWDSALGPWTQPACITPLCPAPSRAGKGISKGSVITGLPRASAQCRYPRAGAPVPCPEKLSCLGPGLQGPFQCRAWVLKNLAVPKRSVNDHHLSFFTEVYFTYIKNLPILGSPSGSAV